MGVAGAWCVCYTGAENETRGTAARHVHVLADADMASGPGEGNGRVDVSETASMSAGIAARYAAALFDLAKEEGSLAALEADVEALDEALSGSVDFQTLIGSPVIPRWDQERSVTAIAAKMGLSGLLGNTLALMAQRRRLFMLPHLLTDLRKRIAAERGEVTAEVVSATPLTKEQANKLAETLKARVGKAVKLKTTVDESLIGGLVVKLGSMMIDTSIRAKLAGLKNAMKEVG